MLVALFKVACLALLLVQLPALGALSLVAFSVLLAAVSLAAVIPESSLRIFSAVKWTAKKSG